MTALQNLIMGKSPNDPTGDATPSSTFYAWDALALDAPFTQGPRLTDDIRDTLAAWERTYPSYGMPFSAYLDKTYITPEGDERFAWELFQDFVTVKITFEEMTAELQPQRLSTGETTGAEWFWDFAQDQQDNQRRWRGVTSGGGQGWTQNDVDNAAAAIRDRLAKWGQTMADEEIDKLALTAVQYEYNDSRLVDALLDGVDFASISEGEIGQTKNNVLEYANRYLVRLSEGDANDIVGRMFRQELSLEGLQAYLTEQAKIQMPFLGTYLERGFSPIDVFKSPMNLAAEELGIDVAEIDLMKPEWNNVFIRTNDKGESRVATNMEVRDAVRNMEGWEQTDSARRAATDISMWVGNIMGVI